MSEINPDSLKIYLTFVVNALRGGNPIGTSHFLVQNMTEILEVSEILYGDMEQETIYRGVILPKPTKYLKPHKNFPYISCTDDLKVAEHFADPGPKGFGVLFGDLGDYGYVVDIDPPYTILFHYSFAFGPLVEFFESQFGEGMEIIAKQREVMILQPMRDIRIKRPVISK